MPASTPGQRAKWRVERAVKAGKALNPADIELMQAENLDIPLNLSQEEMAKMPLKPTLENQDKEPLPVSPPSPPPDPIPLRPSQNPTTSPINQSGAAQNLKDTVGNANTQALKKLTKNERVHVDFWATEFGPICVLVLWFVMADLDKASFYAPSPDECRAASISLGRISARATERLNMPEWAGDAFMTAIDMKDLGFAAMAYLERIGVLTKLQNYYSGVAARARKGDGSVGSNVHPGEVSNGNGYLDIGKLGIGNQYRPI